jgi:hypothetical protein
MSFFRFRRFWRHEKRDHGRGDRERKPCYRAGMKLSWPTLALLAITAVAPPGLAHADDDETRTFSHQGQIGVHLQVASGFRVLFPYDEQYCGQIDKSVCTGRSPTFLDAGITYGISHGLELLFEVHLGLEEDFDGQTGTPAGPRPFGYGAGLRFYVDPDGKLKFFSSIEGYLETTDYSKTTATAVNGNPVAVDSAADFGLKNVNGLIFDFHRTFGLYAHFGETATFANWLRFELHAGLGVQARFP